MLPIVTEVLTPLWPLLGALVVVPLLAAKWLRRPYRSPRGPDRDVRMIFDEVPDLMCVTRLDGRIRESNRAWFEILGYAGEQLAGARLPDLVLPADREAITSAIEKLHTTPTTMQAVARVQNVSGSHRWILWSVTAPLGEPVILWCGKDITLIREARLSLERHAAELRAENDGLRAEVDRGRDSSKLKSLLLSQASQQIRTPLNGVAGMTELLLTTPLDPEQKEYAETIREASESLMLVLNGLIEYSRLEAKQVEFDSTPFDPAAIASGVLLLFTARAQHPRVALGSWPAEGLPQTVVGDPRRLRQILINLVSNAVQFTPSGSIQLGLEIVARREAEVSLRFTVKDTGIGIPPERMDRLFEPFAGGSQGGRGLGLAITKQLAESMGGQIGAESRPGKGSRFWVTLPFRLREQTAGAAPRANHSPAKVVPVALGNGPRKRSALVAEDNPINQKLARQLLEREGYQVTIAGDGHAAVEEALARSYDLILMDVHMPVMDGLTATEEIRRRARGGHRVPIIALTAGGTRADRESCLASGMDGFLPKPITSEALRGALNQRVGDAARPEAAAAGM